MATKGGITAQQYIRKRHGIDVRHVINQSGYFAEVVKDKSVIVRYPDDICPLLSNTVVVFQKLYHLLRPGPIEHFMSPVSISLGSDPIRGALDAFDFAKFETVLLPVLEKESGLGPAISKYNKFKKREDIGEDYECFHYLSTVFHLFTVWTGWFGQESKLSITFRDDRGKFKNGFVEIPLIQMAIDKIKEMLEENVRSESPNEVFLKVIDRNEMLVEFRDTSKLLSENEVGKVANIVNNAVSTLFDNIAKFLKTEDYMPEAIIPLINQSRDMYVNGLKELVTI